MHYPAILSFTFFIHVLVYNRLGWNISRVWLPTTSVIWYRGRKGSPPCKKTLRWSGHTEMDDGECMKVVPREGVLEGDHKWNGSTEWMNIWRCGILETEGARRECLNNGKWRFLSYQPFWKERKDKTSETWTDTLRTLPNINYTWNTKAIQITEKL